MEVVVPRLKAWLPPESTAPVKELGARREPYYGTAEQAAESSWQWEQQQVPHL